VAHSEGPEFKPQCHKKKKKKFLSIDWIKQKTDEIRRVQGGMAVDSSRRQNIRA
jgi:hypothetical protein